LDLQIEKIEEGRIKTPADNRQFGASGGVVSWDISQDFGSFAPVRALPIPPPAPSCHHVSRHPYSAATTASRVTATLNMRLK